MEEYKNSGKGETIDKRNNVAKTLAYQTAIKPGKLLSKMEMQTLIDELFACEQPLLNPAGLATFVQFTFDEIEHKFNAV